MLLIEAPQHVGSELLLIEAPQQLHQPCQQPWKLSELNCCQSKPRSSSPATLSSATIFQQEGMSAKS